MKQVALIIIIVLAVMGIGFLLFKYGNKPLAGATLASLPSESQLRQNLEKAGLQALSAEGTAFHIHQHLDIIINGEKTAVPASLGIGSNFISEIHTHNTSGVLHVEAPAQKDFKLSQFFDQWGIKFDDNCIADYCANEQNKLIVAVNGQQISNARDYVLKSHDEIEVWYGPKDETPRLIESYSFQAGE